MGSVADCFANALAESVFATLQCELFDQQPGGRFTSRREAKLAVFDYLETFYNPRLRHSALGQISPAIFEHKSSPKAPQHDHARSNPVSAKAVNSRAPNLSSIRDGHPRGHLQSSQRLRLGHLR